jgi:hypothetical protein
MRDALADVVEAQTQFRRGRQLYHLALLLAEKDGETASTIAEALGTNPLYIENTLRLHREGKCECGARRDGMHVYLDDELRA